MKHNYKIVEEKEHWKDSVIEKDNIVAKFTIRDFENNIERMQKTLRELEAKHKVELAVMDNIERNHPFVKDLTDEQLNTAWMYQEAKAVVVQYAPRIAEFYEALNAEVKEMEDVKKRFKFTDGEG